jgi:cytidyltransferase-like protein
MKVVAIYPGRFHPFHKGHASSFKQLAEKFGLDNTFLAISAKQEQPKSPFSAQDRAKMAVSLGIPSKNIIAVRNPYAAQEYIDQLNLDPEQTALIFGVSKKDMEGEPALGIPPDPRFGFKPKKDGSLSYLQPFDKSKVDPMSQHGYVMSTDVAEFPIAGKTMRDASAIRSAYAGADNKTKMKILGDLYGDAAEKMKQVFDNNLQVTESIRRLITMIKPMLSEASIEQKQKFVRLLENVRGMDRSRLALYNPDGQTYRGTQNKMPTLGPDPAQDAEPLDSLSGSYEMDTKPIELAKLRKFIKSRLDLLDERESQILISRFGLDGEEPMSLKQLADVFNTGPERIRQIEARVLRKLKHLTISRPLRAFDMAINEVSEKLYSARQAEIVEDLGNGYFLGDDSYDDDDGFVKAGYSVYYQEGPDQYRQVGNVSMSPYSNPRGHVENEIKKLIASDQTNLSESTDYLEEK